jgi:predicted ester cyclase
VSDQADLNKERSRRLYEEVFGTGDYGAADELMAPDVISHGPGLPPSVGTEGIKRQAALLRTAFPDFRVILNDQVAEADRVVSHWTGTGTHSGPLTMPGVDLAPTGNSISFEEIRIDRYAAGRIAEAWFIPDRFTLWRQLGLLPEPPR